MSAGNTFAFAVLVGTCANQPMFEGADFRFGAPVTAAVRAGAVPAKRMRLRVVVYSEHPSCTAASAFCVQVYVCVHLRAGLRGNRTASGSATLRSVGTRTYAAFLFFFDLPAGRSLGQLVCN